MIQKLALRMSGPVFFWLSWPVSYFWLKHTERSRVLVLAAGNVLLVRPWHGTGAWSLPGGGVKSGETARGSAVRETQEETGLVLEASELHELGLKAYAHAGLVVTCRYFIYELAAPVRLRPARPEIIESRWVPQRELSRYVLTPDVRQGLRVHRQAKNGII